MAVLQPWQLLSSTLVVDHRWCQVRQDTVQLPNGIVIDDYFVNVRPDVALVLALTLERKIVFVRQYRHGVGKILLELPAGTFDPGQESPEAAAARELEEETGYRAERLAKLATLYDNPVKDTNQIHVFLGTGATATALPCLDSTEEIEIVLIPLEEVEQCIYRGEIAVAGTLAALFLGLNCLRHPNR